MTNLNYYTMIPVSESAEYLKVIEGKKAKTTDEQYNSVKQQAENIWGDLNKITISPLGVVFGSANGEIYTLGRVDAQFNFYSK